MLNTDRSNLENGDQLTIDFFTIVPWEGVSAVPDLPERVIATTALLHGVPILSRDRRITQAGLQTIW